MNKLVLGLVSFIAVLGIGAVFLQRETNTALRAEITGLRGDVEQLTKQVSESNRVREVAASQMAPNATAAETARSEADRVELAKLRDEVAAIKKGTQEVARVALAAQQAAKGESPVPLKLTPVSELKNAGRATASAAIETLLGAAVGGDVETLASGIVLEPGAATKAAELFAQLPDAARAQYGSPEKLIALMIAKDAAALTGMQILGQREITPDIVGVRVRLANEEGKTKEQGYGLQKTDSGLKLRIPEEAVDKYAKQLAGGGK